MCREIQRRIRSSDVCFLFSPFLCVYLCCVFLFNLLLLFLSLLTQHQHSAHTVIAVVIECAHELLLTVAVFVPLSVRYTMLHNVSIEKWTKSSSSTGYKWEEYDLTVKQIKYSKHKQMSGIPLKYFSYWFFFGVCGIFSHTNSYHHRNRTHFLLIFLYVIDITEFMAIVFTTLSVFFSNVKLLSIGMFSLKDSHCRCFSTGSSK